ncbi:hypothetical protein [Ectobacillus sp. sgz5001026]|uniref:hypothetical protein n=1 Tax=Ectobacillus sp. sgz5001026 TaxID=3242473 RepID=UPI0036D30B87
MHPQMYPIPFRSDPVLQEDTRFLPFFGVPFLAGIAGGLLGGALAFGPRPYPYYPQPYPYPTPYPYPAPYSPYMY